MPYNVQRKMKYIQGGKFHLDRCLTKFSSNREKKGTTDREMNDLVRRDSSSIKHSGSTFDY